MITLEPYQDRAAKFLSELLRAMVHSPAGSGKTIIASAAIDRVVRAKRRDRRVRIGWMANTIEQCDQGRKALKAFPAIVENCEWTVFCPSGAPAAEFDVLIVDECQHATAPSWKAVIEQHEGAVWMFSATPWGEDEERNVELRAMVDNQVFVIARADVKKRVVHGIVQMIDATDEHLEGTSETMQAGIDAVIERDLTRMVSRVLYGPARWEYWAKVADRFCAEHSIYPGNNADQTWGAVAKAKKTKEANEAIHAACSKDMWPRVAFKVCLDLGIAKNRQRNRKVIELAKSHAEDSTLILIHSVAHGEGLADHLPGAIVCHSKMGAKKRRLAIEGFRTGAVRCLIATSLADEGLDVPRANVLVMACGGKNANRTEQRAGRATRAFDEFKTHGTIYDFHDYQHTLLASQSRKRQAVYKELGFTVEDYAPDQLRLFSKQP